MSVFATALYAGTYMGTAAGMPGTVAPPLCDHDHNGHWPCASGGSTMPYMGPFTKPFTVTVSGNSLKRNVTRIVKQGPWKQVIWDLPYDYHWIGKAKVTGGSLQDVIARLIEPYPLQVEFYEANKVVVIKPRTKANV